MTAGELTIHETRTLDGVGAGDDEPFLAEGTGSAFVSRPGELVWVRSSAAGLQALPEKVRRLVDRGLHGVVVSLQGIEALPDPRAGLAALLQASRHVEQFAGWLRVVDASPGLVASLQALPGGDEVRFLSGRAAALEDYRRHLAEAGEEDQEEDVLSGLRSDELPIRPREILPQPRPDDWGWSGEGEGQSAEGDDLPAVEIAELFLEEGELGGLVEQARAALTRGRRYMTLRVHFKRGAQRDGQELAALSEARDLLAREGGQLVLAALQAGFEEWLRSTGGFQIADDADQAERLHRLHAAGQLQGDEPARVEPPLVIVTQSRDRLVIRPRELRDQEGLPRTTRPVRVLRLGTGSLARLSRRLAGLPREGVEDAIGDLGEVPSVDGLRAELVTEAALGAVAAGVGFSLCDVSPEVHAYLRLHGLEEELLHGSLERAALQHAARLHAREPFQELALELSREDLDSGAREEAELAGAARASSSATSSLAAPARVSAAPLPAATLAPLPAPAQPAESGLVGSNGPAQALAAAELAQVRLRLSEAERARAELEQALRREERRQIEAEQGLARAERRVAEQERLATVARAEAEALRDQLRSAQRERDEARDAAGAAETRAREAESRAREVEERLARLQESLTSAEGLAQVRQGELQAREAELEGLRERARRAGELEAQLGELPELRQRVTQLERDKARILTEAEQEIERLSREQEALREELESAGEMIERLGKELEHS